MRYFIVCAKMEVSVGVAGLARQYRRQNMRSGPIVPYWNEVVNEKCVELTRMREETGSV